MLTDVIIRQGLESDLPALEWGGEFAHFHRLFADTFQLVRDGRALIWIAELPECGLIAQLFISLSSHRTDLADGKNRAYLYGFRVIPVFRGKGLGTVMILTVENDLIRRGFTYLTLNVSQKNKRAIRFYKKIGYRIIFPDPGKWSYLDNMGRNIDVNEPAWRMVKCLKLGLSD